MKQDNILYLLPQKLKVLQLDPVSPNDKSQIPGPDPVKWNLNLDSINFLLANPPKIDISTIPFAETKRMFGNISRRLTPEHFMRKLQNGEKKLREWVLYSPSKNALFCFQCLLFSPKPTVFGNKNEGFINWKKCNECLQEHETTSRGLAFRGNSHNFGSKQNGNYLGCLELVAKFDPFLSAHIANYGNKGKGNVSYLSSNICDEFITLMSNTVIDKIVSEIKERKYFSLIVDSTPDVTTRDQLTVAIRYISNEGLPVERFLGFIPSVGHKGSDMEQALLKKFCELNIDLKYCRGQSYDNASNMSGIYNGLQTRIKNYSSTAFFVPCSAHSLNLIGSNAADTTQEGTKFFFICQAIYNFFSVSTFRWNILTNIIEKNPGCVKIKKLCSTRWSSRYDVCKAMYNGYAQVLSALNTICDDEGQKKDTRHEARSIKNKIESLNFCFMICMWTPILQRFNATSISLQSIDIDLATVVTLYESLEKYVEDFRERFDVYIQQAKTMCSKQLFSWDGVRQKKRNKFFDETENNDELLEGVHKMKCEVFFVIIDRLVMNLRERKLSYTDINNNFGFILKLDILDNNEIRESAKNLVKIYPEDLNETFIEELLENHLKLSPTIPKPGKELNNWIWSTVSKALEVSNLKLFKMNNSGTFW
ncbi:zinc finger MYM-type protein 1-like [Rhopalosiphum padi]|uniref:zinc finger MYM-type protein 1-like n=1 Tax=Rhopalosiphum padi TaxID=40932 RepID=UPI00298E707D|nr:zinc finger MYM-type protein 1-like [Rhopalosiphum padi]